MKDSIRKLTQNILAPGNTLRAGINLSNFLLVDPDTHPTESNKKGADTAEELDGVSPDMARALAKELGVSISLIPYPNPGILTDRAKDGNEFSVGLVGSEAKRREVMAFTKPYCEIGASYLVKSSAPFEKIEDVDRGGVRICVSARSAYDLWLTANLRNATLIRTEVRVVALCPSCASFFIVPLRAPSI